MDETQRLLRDARRVLARYMFNCDDIPDDIAELCMKIDDVLPPEEEAGIDVPLNAAA